MKTVHFLGFVNCVPHTCTGTRYNSRHHGRAWSPVGPPCWSGRDQQGGGSDLKQNIAKSRYTDIKHVSDSNFCRTELEEYET